MNLRGLFSRRRDPDVSDPDLVMRAPRGEWRSLPPLQRLAPATTTIDVGFDRHLATAGSPSFLGELGHLVNPDGPGGLITSLTGTFIEKPGSREAGGAVDASARRIEYGARSSGRVAVSSPSATLSRAPDPPIQRHLDAHEPEAAIPSTDDVEPPALDPPLEPVPLEPVPLEPVPEAGAAPGPDTESPAVLAASSDPPADASAPALGARPLLEESGSHHGETVAAPIESPFTVTFDGEPVHPSSAPTIARATERAPRTPASAPVQRRAEPSATSPRADPGTSATEPAVSRPLVSRRGAEEVTAGLAGEGGHDSAAAADVVLPVLSRSTSPLGVRPRIGSPLDTTMERTDRTEVQCSQSPRPDHFPPSSGVGGEAPPPIHISRDAEPPVAPGPSSDEHAVDVSSAEFDAPTPHALAPTIQPLLGSNPPVLSRAASPEEEPHLAPSVGRSQLEAGPATLSGPTSTGSSNGSPTTTTPPTMTRPTTTPSMTTGPGRATPDSQRTASQSVQRRAEPTEGHGTLPSAPVERSIAAQRPTLGLDGWTPRPIATAAASTDVARSGARDGEARAHASVAPPEVVQRATYGTGEPAMRTPLPPIFDSGNRLPAGSSGTTIVSRSTSGSAAATLHGGPPMSPSAPVALPPSILGAIGHASEVTPLGHAALEASTVTWEDAPVLQRAAAPEGSTSTYPPTEFHAEAAWVPTSIQRAPVDAPAESTDASGDIEAVGPLLAGASEADVIGLMRTMYPHLRRRLTRDLLLDRERAGHRTDIRY